VKFLLEKVDGDTVKDVLNELKSKLTEFLLAFKGKAVATVLYTLLVVTLTLILPLYKCDIYLNRYKNRYHLQVRDPMSAVPI
jgi:type IV secretory pathway component VirB8